MTKSFFIVPVVWLTVCLSGNLAAIDWPILRDSTYKPVGNSYGQYQCYGDPCSPYMHTGIDIMAPTGTPVYAVKAGYVKAVLTTSEGADAYWRIVIADSAGPELCDGYMYAHVDQYSIPVYPGDYVEEGQYIGDVVYFPYSDFNHLHFSKIRYYGTNLHWSQNWADWIFISDPLDDMDIINDLDAPVFENAIGTRRYAFCGNQTGDYFDDGETLNGEVDIIARVYDYINDYDHKLTPHLIEYKIDGEPWITSFDFSDAIGPYGSNMDNLVSLIFRDDSVCDSKGDYDFRDYYFNVTNTDGDGLLEMSDAAGAWFTADYNNGEHTVYVRASDRSGHTTIDSMKIAIANFFSLQGTVLLDDAVPQSPEGVVVTVLSSNQADTVDGGGDFMIVDVGGGNQAIEVARPGFLTADTVIMMNQNRLLEVSLIPGGFVAGDANCDGDPNVGDAVYIINYVFKGGPAPIPYLAGNANGDAEVNVGDAVYMINYIFKGGPPPVRL